MLREYGVWKGMRKRCNNRNCASFCDYGDRGITICERWDTFENFLEDMGPRPVGTSIERINNDGDYEPSNCKWATRKEQNNNKRTNRMLVFTGRKQTLAQWGVEVGIPDHILSTRLRRGWSVERTLTFQSSSSRSKLSVVFQNEKLTPAQWDKKLGFNRGRTFDRIFMKGWTIEKALTSPQRMSPRLEIADAG